MVYVSQVKRAIICRAQWEVHLYLMNKSNMRRPSVLVLLSSKLSCKPKTWLHQGWPVVLAHLEICSSIPSSSGTHSCIFMVYSDGAESRRKMRSHQNVHESWSYLKSRESQTFACWPWETHHSAIINMIVYCVKFARLVSKEQSQRIRNLHKYL